MRPFDPIHGIDYLVDYYALLDVGRNADEQQIKSAFREKMRGYHPDVLARAAPELKAQAEAKTKVYIRAYEILTDKEKKADYDETLRKFDPEHISDSGIAIYDPKRKRIDIDFLVSGAKWDRKYFVTETLRQSIGYDESAFNFIEQQFKSTDTPSHDLRRLYLDQLAKKQRYLSMLEQMAWEEAGVSNQERPSGIFIPKQHAEEVRVLTEKTKEKIKKGVEERVLALAKGTSFQALTEGDYTYDAYGAMEHAVQIKERVTEIALRNFETNIPAIEELSRRTVLTLEEAVQLTDWEYHPPNQQYSNNLIIFFPHEGTIIGGVPVEINEHGPVVSRKIEDFNGMSVQEFKSDSVLSRLKVLMKSGYNISLLYRNPDFGFELQIQFIINRHIDKSESV